MNYLNPTKALIFRITHIENLPWILDNGLYCRNSKELDPKFKCIGNEKIIAKRSTRPVPEPPGGTLSDYVPFYFTPCSIMLFNIKTGYNEVKQYPMEEIVTLITDLHSLKHAQIDFLFTDRHAKLDHTLFSSDLRQLSTMVRWDLLQACDFKIDPRHPEKKECYQAEALIHKHLPVENLKAIGCCSKDVGAYIQAQLQRSGIQNITVVVRPNWFFL